MKRGCGYTVMELLITVSLLTILTSISLISIASPKRLLEKETVLAEVSQLINQIQLEPMLKGQASKVSFTPWVVWVNEQKRLEFPQDSGWQWETAVKDLSIQPDNTLSIIDSKGQAVHLPQEVVLTYNQSRVAAIRLTPDQNVIRVVRVSELNDTCPH